MWLVVSDVLPLVRVVVVGESSRSHPRPHLFRPPIKCQILCVGYLRSSRHRKFHNLQQFVPRHRGSVRKFLSAGVGGRRVLCTYTAGHTADLQLKLCSILSKMMSTRGRVLYRCSLAMCVCVYIYIHTHFFDKSTNGVLWVRLADVTKPKPVVMFQFIEAFWRSSLSRSLDAPLSIFEVWK